MTEQERIESIRNAVANNNAEISNGLENLIAELKAEKMAEDLVLEHGLLDATKSEITDEVSALASSQDKAEEDCDFDNDENLQDMEAVSPLMREIFEENKSIA
jgi:Skp family chaperone for outer membrane proteins